MRPRNAYTPTTEATLRSLAAKDMKFTEIAEHLGIEYNDLCSAMKVLGITSNWYMPKGVAAALPSIASRMASGVKLSVLAAEYGMPPQKLGRFLNKAGLPNTNVEAVAHSVTTADIKLAMSGDPKKREGRGPNRARCLAIVNKLAVGIRLTVQAERQGVSKQALHKILKERGLPTTCQAAVVWKRQQASAG